MLSHITQILVCLLIFASSQPVASEQRTSEIGHYAVTAVMDTVQWNPVIGSHLGLSNMDLITGWTSYPDQN